MKKLMLLGGSKAQLIAIEKAKELGYYTVLCDYLTDNPGQYIADKYYPVSTTDKEAVLTIAETEKIDGIVAYSSDPAAPTAAYVAMRMGLRGIDYDIAKNFCEKQLFRKFLKENGFNVPMSIEIHVPYSIENIDVSELEFPVIVKPTDSSGSKGVTVLDRIDGLSEALKYAEKYSRNGCLIIEEFIQRDHPHVIEAEIFAIEGEVKSWGLMNSIRDSYSNPLLPAGYSYPLDMDIERTGLVKREVSRLVKATGNTSGAFNIEMIIDKKGNLYFLDAGPRNGGNILPEYISLISGKDIVGATIRNAMGETAEIDVDLDGLSGGYWSMGVLHSTTAGIFKAVKYREDAARALVREEIQKEIGDHVNAFERCNDLVGLSIFHFDSKADMDAVMYDMANSINIELS